MIKEGELLHRRHELREAQENKLRELQREFK